MTRPETNEPRVNRRIRVPRVLVIDENGTRLGEFLTPDALALAEERGLDLIEVAPEGHPPVCKIADYGQMKYDKKKRETQARKNQVKVQIKEVKVRPKTHGHDFDVKVRHTRRFLENGDKVKVTVRFRGRELAHRNIGVDRCTEIATACEDLGAIELHPRMDGRQMVMILAPFKKKVARGERRGQQKPAAAEADVPDEETPESPVEETDESPVEETDESPVEETDESPVEETDESPAEEADESSVEEPDKASADEASDTAATG